MSADGNAIVPVNVDVGVGEWRVWMRCLVGGELRGMAVARWMLVSVVVAVEVGVRACAAPLGLR